ncbi:MAG: hypothetical protein Q7Q73_13285 [Verrucomicrobiota bacterium JB024]|nr:hypothetical protein [Verrucomicrobiota bacterium JB024]
MKSIRLLPLLFVLPLLALLSGCDKKVNEEAEAEATAPMAKGIEQLADEVQNKGQMSGNVPIEPEQVVSLTLSVPTPAWSLTIDEVWVVGQEMWALATLHENTEGMVAQVISTAKASVTLKDVPKLPITYYVIGKTFDWEKAGPTVKFIKSKAEIEEGLNSGEQVYPKQ